MTEYPQGIYGGQPPHNGTDTSKAAAQQAKPNTLRESVLAAITHAAERGCTADELHRTFNKPMSSVTARVRELVLLDKIKDSGRRRKTQFGRDARVYVAAGQLDLF